MWLNRRGDCLRTTVKSLSPETYYVQVMAMDIAGVTDCPPNLLGRDLTLGLSPVRLAGSRVPR